MKGFKYNLQTYRIFTHSSDSMFWLIEREFAITSSISDACSTEQALASTRSIEHGSAHSESTRLRIELKLFTIYLLKFFFFLPLLFSMLCNGFSRGLPN